MKLYYSPGACSLVAAHRPARSRPAVRARARQHQDAQARRTAPTTTRINPKGYVPLLELDDGERLTEGPAIVQYIADQVPDKKLAPRRRDDGALPAAGVAQLHHQRAAQGLRPAVQPGDARGGQDADRASKGLAAADSGSTQQLEGKSLPDGRRLLASPTPTCSRSPTGPSSSASTSRRCKNLGAFMARMARAAGGAGGDEGRRPAQVAAAPDARRRPRCSWPRSRRRPAAAGPAPGRYEATLCVSASAAAPLSCGAGRARGAAGSRAEVRVGRHRLSAAPAARAGRRRDDARGGCRSTSSAPRTPGATACCSFSDADKERALRSPTGPRATRQPLAPASSRARAQARCAAASSACV